MGQEWQTDQLRADLDALRGKGPDPRELETFLSGLLPIRRRRWIEAIRRSAQSLSDGSCAVDVQDLRLGDMPLQWAPSETKVLGLRNQELQDFPEWIKELKALTSLNVSYNSLGSLPEGIKELKALTSLDVSVNRLESLPKAVFELPLIARLNLLGNPLPGTAAASTDPDFSCSVLYGKDLAPLNQVKIVICGQAMVGKTTLRTCLVTGAPPASDPPDTKGIDIDETDRLGSPGQPLYARIWDFGGQVILHHTHQIFLTEKTIYLLVAFSRMDADNNKVGHWLKTIQAFAPEAPVILVDNISDICDHTHAADYYANAKGRFSNVKGVVKIDALQNKNVDDLIAKIRSIAGDMPEVREPLPSAFIELLNNVAKLAAAKPTLSQEEFEEACRDAGVEDPSIRDGMRERLSQLGIALKPIEWSHRIYVLQPSWVTEGIYRIIRSPKVSLVDKLLPVRVARQLLPDDRYRADEKGHILDLMVHYGLALYDDPARRVNMLVPALADGEEPDTGDWTGSTDIYYQYDELLEGIIPRIVIDTWQPAPGVLQVSNNTFWQKGVILTWNGCRVRVCDIESERLQVQALGPEALRPEALDRVREIIHKVNAAFANVNPDEWVSFSDGASRPYEDLLAEFRAGSLTCWVGGVVRNIEEELRKVIRAGDRAELWPRENSALPAASPLAAQHKNWLTRTCWPLTLGVPAVATAIGGGIVFFFFPTWYQEKGVETAFGLAGVFLAAMAVTYAIWHGGLKKAVLGGHPSPGTVSGPRCRRGRKGYSVNPLRRW
jgi:internalin A